MKLIGNITLPELISAIRSGPQGPQVAAVFDFGGTVVAGFAPIATPLRRWRHRDSDAALADTLLHSIRGARTEGEFEHFLQHTTHAWSGHRPEELRDIGARLFRSTIHGHLYPEAWQLIREHEAAGHTVVLATSLTGFQVLPAAAELGIDHVLHTRMATADGLLTGFTDGKPLWRTEKAAAVARFAVDHDIDPARSYAYADAAPDIPLLEWANTPIAVNPGPRMVLAARQREWPVLSFRPRESPRLVDLARTAAGFTGLLSGAAFGAASRAGTRERRPMADAMISTAAAATLRSTGVRIRVSGADHARAPRPAVFLFNHQSQFDMVVLAAVLRSGFTAIVKKEVTTNPVFGPLLRFAEATFIDRSDTTSAKTALEPVVDTLRGGLSIVVAPEGTRSLTPRIGPFKKGAFHIAIAAGVPVIPLVIRNAGEIAWRNSAVVRKGTVDVAVLPPIDVGAWDPRDMDADIARVRQLFVDTLLDWPAAD